MSSIRFEDVELGEELPELQPDVSMERVRRFCAAANMTVGRFTDHEKARSQGLPSAIVPGIMSQALLSTLVHRWAPGCQVQKMDTIFRAPVQVDSKPTCCAVITDTDPEGRIVEIDLTIVNEEGETRVVGTATVKL